MAAVTVAAVTVAAVTVAAVTVAAVSGVLTACRQTRPLAVIAVIVICNPMQISSVGAAAATNSRAGLYLRQCQFLANMGRNNLFRSQVSRSYVQSDLPRQ